MHLSQIQIKPATGLCLPQLCHKINCLLILLSLLSTLSLNGGISGINKKYHIIYLLPQKAGIIKCDYYRSTSMLNLLTVHTCVVDVV